jgi:hypothetical protein
MPTLPTVPETESNVQGGWVRSKHDIPADEEAVVLDSWPGADESDEDDEDAPTEETESGTPIVVPHGGVPHGHT